VVDSQQDPTDDEKLRRWATSTRRLIVATLRQTPEQRLADLHRASAFFHAARRV